MSVRGAFHPDVVADGLFEHPFEGVLIGCGGDQPPQSVVGAVGGEEAVRGRPGRTARPIVLAHLEAEPAEAPDGVERASRALSGLA